MSGFTGELLSVFLSIAYHIHEANLGPHGER
jgi:hypothetical protein